MRKRMFASLVASIGAVALAGCLGSTSSGGGTGGGGGGGGGTGDPSGGGSTGVGSPANGQTGTGDPGGSSSSDPGGSSMPAENPILAARSIDYGQALRTAAVKLVGTIPTMDEQAAVTDSTSYAAQIDKYLADPRFAGRLLSYFQDMMRMGGSITTTAKPAVTVSLDTAPTFAAELVVNDRPITDLFTAATNTCPKLDPATGTFTDAVCPVANGLTTSGVLTDPGAMAQFFSNMSFRRVRWVQEVFVCTKFPTEFTATPVQMGSGQYVSPWPFTSIAGGATALINFQDTSSVVCANCHTTMNHIAPLFAQFDTAGVFQTTIQVQTPIPTTPITKLADWLPAGEQLSWRYKTPVNSLTDLGAAMAKDPDVADCQVARAWNWAMSKDDIVNDLATVPQSTIATLEAQLVSGNYQMKPVFKAIFTSDDFVKF
jgi:hypothetical protein